MRRLASRPPTPRPLSSRSTRRPAGYNSAAALNPAVPAPISGTIVFCFGKFMRTIMIA